MRRAREAELARLAARSTAAEDAAARRKAALRARVKLGAALRLALAQSGIDPAEVTMLRISDEAAHELATTADRPKPAAGKTPLIGDRQPDGSAAAFETRIDELVRRCRDGQGIDPARTSLAEVLAWCLGRLASSAPRGPGQGEQAGARIFAADLLQKQRQDGGR